METKLSFQRNLAENIQKVVKMILALTLAHTFLALAVTFKSLPHIFKNITGVTLISMI